MSNVKKSAFNEPGFRVAVDNILEEIREIYLSDSIPWVVGYSGGKDSTAVLQLVWMAIEGLPIDLRQKAVHVISTDTLVENPVVAAWVNQSLVIMKESAEGTEMPIFPHRLTPKVTDSFWVNLIGKGYPAPRPKFRWCTERLKINPANSFVRNVVKESGESILVLGVRKAESSARAASINRHSQKRVREKLSPSPSLTNCLVYSPIEDWSNDDVWMYLMQVPNPWGYNNRDLLTMYQGASPDGECPLVIDTTTPSCGDSRFGCWVCTLVSQDKSMAAMIQNDQEKEWMLPLLTLRNDLDVEDDRHLRDFRRMSGLVQISNGKNIPGPYTQSTRENWLKRVLEAQTNIRCNPKTPESVREIELITLAELREIRRVWLIDKHEIEDSLPRIYKAVVGLPFPAENIGGKHGVFGEEEIRLLKELCDENALHFELSRELLSITQRFSSQSRRSGLYDALDKAFKKSFYKDQEDAIERARRRQELLDSARSGNRERASLEHAKVKESPI